MKYLVIGLAALLFCMPAAAHRLTVFAWMEGETLVLESAFGRGAKLKNGDVEVRDAATGGLLLKGKTDAEGVFRCALPQGIRESGHDMRIIALGGEGHRGVWTVKAEEWKASLARGGIPEPRAEAAAETPLSLAEPRLSPAAEVLSAADLERILAEVLEAKLAPLRRELAAVRSGAPGLREVIGGLGWIIGLFGTLAWCRSKKER